MEKRIIDLEMKFLFQEELIGQLNEIVTEQQFVIEHLKKEVAAIKSSTESTVSGSERSLKDDVPPHY